MAGAIAIIVWLGLVALTLAFMAGADLLNEKYDREARGDESTED